MPPNTTTLSDEDKRFGRGIKCCLKALAYLSLGYFSYLMILITLQYVPIRYDVAFLNVKYEEIVYTHYKVAFFSHVYSSIIVLLAGLLQFSTWLRTQFPTWHRRVGKIYIVLILGVASPSGLVMAYHANGGPWSQLSFTLQAVLWFGFTYYAYRAVRLGAWRQHEDFMLRSYALTLSAISLRLFKWGIVQTLALAPMDTYRIVAWLGWLFNYLLIEYYIFRKNKTNVV